MWDDGKYQELDRDGTERIDTLTQQLNNLVNEKVKIIQDLEQEFKSSSPDGSLDYIDASDPNDVAKLNLQEHPNFDFPVDVDQSVIKFADGIPRDDPAVTNAIKRSAALDKVFRAKKDKTTWQYFGSAEGVFRRYPGSEWDKDSSGSYLPFDPRFRAWYVGASSGPKDIVLVLDKSGSMSGSRMDIAKDAAITVLDTLTNQDYVNVVMFGSSAELSSCFSDKLVRAMPENIKKLKQFVSDTSSGGGTNFEAGFEAAFDLLDKTYADEDGSHCQPTILFMTDGQASDPSSLINDRQYDENPVTIFSYALGSGADEDIPRSIAEENNGIFFSIEDGGNLRTQMGRYYTHFASGIDLDRPLWTAPYYDVNGLGLVITISLPVFDGDSLLGVLGTDVVVAELFSEAFSTQSHLSYSFVINQEGQVLTHPRLQSPAVYTEPPTYVDISSLETSSSFSSVRSSMIGMGSGTQKMTVKRALPRGDVEYEGMRFQDLSVTYLWASVPKAGFSVGYALADSDRIGIEWKNPDNYGTSWYHRIDLVPGTDGGGDIDVQYEGGNLYLTKSASTVKIAPKGFDDSHGYQTEPENAETVRKYNDYFNDKSGSVQNPGFQRTIASTVRISQPIAEEVWKPNFDDTKMLFTYFATDNGVFRVYPGYNSNKTFNAAHRPWYLRALSNRGNLAVSTPYKDASYESIGDRYIVTISHTVQEPRRDGNVIGVAGIDFLYESFEDLVNENIPRCAEGEVNCALVDSSGLVVVHPNLGSQPPSNAFMGESSSYDMQELTEKLLNEGEMERKQFKDYSTLKDIRYYEFKQEADYTDITTSKCLRATHQVTPVPGSNLFLVVTHNPQSGSQTCVSYEPQVKDVDICTENISPPSNAKCYGNDASSSSKGNNVFTVSLLVVLVNFMAAFILV